MKQYAVWAAGEFDKADWFTDHDTALDAWHKLAQTLPDDDGEGACMQRFDEDGDPDENYAHELRRDGSDILEYCGGERQWA